MEALPDHITTDQQKELIFQKTQRFMSWCKDIGIICPKIEYPSFFDGGLIGAKVKEPIQHREAFLYVPQKAIISLDKC